MPPVKSNDTDIQGSLKKVVTRQITRISAFVPGDDGSTAIPVVLSNFTGIGTKNNNGLHLTAEMQYCLGSQDPYPVPRKYGDAVDGVVKGVQLHLCGKACPAESHKVHLGEWFYIPEGVTVSEEEKAKLQPGEAVLLKCLLHPTTTWTPLTRSVNP